MEENLVLRKNVSITASVSQPTGGGALTPNILLNDIAHKPNSHRLDDFSQSRSFDTFDGRNLASGPDSYTITFPELTTFNCIEMTMGFIYRDGGWWNSLDVEVQKTPSAAWVSVEGLQFNPTYNFKEEPTDRRPFKTYVLRFNQVNACAVRISGQPGGIAQFTSMARLAVFQRDFSHWNPIELLEPPTPYIFQLIYPKTIWDISENFTKLTGLIVSTPLMEYYLDEDRYRNFRVRMLSSYDKNLNLWLLIGDHMGWRNSYQVPPISPKKPYVFRLGYNALAQAVAPIVIDDNVLFNIDTSPPVILSDEFDEVWHKNYCIENNINHSTYQASLNNSIWMTYEQLEGAAKLLGMISNIIANLSHRNLILQDNIKSQSKNVRDNKVLIKTAIDFMEKHLETPIRVNDVAEAVALNPSYFCRCFTHQVGQNPSEFLIQMRLERAKYYLSQTDYSVMDVCVTLGYSPSYFSRLFKQRVGCSPRDYARKRRSQDV